MRNTSLSLRARNRARQGVRGAVLGLALLLFMLPILWAVFASFRIVPDNFQTPPAWTPPSLENFTDEIRIAEPTFVQELATSAALSLSATALAVAVSFLAAYGLARSRFRGHTLLVQGCLILASLPVMAYVIPLSDSLRRVRLEDTFVGLWLAQAAVYAPLAVYVLHGYLSQIGTELEEAAVLEGAGPWQILWSVVWPATVPGVAVTALILFVLNWNQFLVPLVLTTSRVRTIPVAMSDFFTFERELQWPTAAAALVVSLVPLAVLVTVAHRLLERFNLAAQQPVE
jgi:ABC-type glycerol-3-phosphate transport system permease component